MTHKKAKATLERIAGNDLTDVARLCRKAAETGNGYYVAAAIDKLSLTLDTLKVVWLTLPMKQ